MLVASSQALLLQHGRDSMVQASQLGTGQPGEVSMEPSGVEPSERTLAAADRSSA